MYFHVFEKNEAFHMLKALFILNENWRMESEPKAKILNHEER